MDKNEIIETLLSHAQNSKCCSRKVCAGIFADNTFKTYVNENLDKKTDACEYKEYKCLECGKTYKNKVFKCCNKVTLPVDLTYTTVIHAEENLIAQNDRKDLINGTIYITDFPCPRCSRLIISSGIKTIYYIRNFNNNESMELLLEHNVNLVKLDIKNIRDEFKELI